MKTKNKGLGRGLDALLGGNGSSSLVRHTSKELSPSSSEQQHLGESVQNIVLDCIVPGPYQPRSHMDDEALDALVQSIRAQGIIQPIVVRQKQEGQQQYELIAGERRWRAAKRAGLEEIPALVRILPDEGVLAVALIENIQRESLDPIEEAVGFRRLSDEFGMTHEQIANVIGRSRASVSNSLRLLALPVAIQDMLHQRLLEMGHARALLGLSSAQQLSLAREIIEHQWSVREVERRVKISQDRKNRTSKSMPTADPNILSLEQKLSDFLGATVSFRHQNARGSGILSIRYTTLDELDRLLLRMQYPLEHDDGGH